MSVHQLTIDSGQRDPSLYPNPNDYTVELEKPIYNVSNIKLVSARIPTPQLLINDTNGRLTYEVQIRNQTTGELLPLGNQQTRTVQQGNHDGTSLAAELTTLNLHGNQININLTYDVAKNMFSVGPATYVNPVTVTIGGVTHTHVVEHVTLIFTGQEQLPDTLHRILGLPATTFTIYNNQNDDMGAGNFSGPNALALRLSSGAEQMVQPISQSSQNPSYTGTILLPGATLTTLPGTDFINVSGTDDKVSHEFHSGPLKSMRDMRVEFFYMNRGELLPYDFRYQDHVLKFEVTCSTDKLENLTPLPPPSTTPPDEEKVETVNIPEQKENLYKVEYIYIGLIIFTGILLILSMGKPRAA
tara:strand:- start:642 stop:1712 length:1071 start_codon:yes stop_codon:yes gene_type:complete